MKIITWNVNSVRVRLERLLAVLARHEPDAVCLQELKCMDEAFPLEAIRDAGYHAAVWGQKTYNGVAILAKEPLTNVTRSFPDDPVPLQARVLSADVREPKKNRRLRLVNLYVVNGKEVGTEHYDIKLAWLDALYAWLDGGHDPKAPLILTGDFNIAPDERDVWDPKRYAGRVHFSLPERKRLNRLLGWGLSDLLRLQTQDAGIYSWWDYRHGAFPKGRGLRLDLFLGTEPVARRSLGVQVDSDERKQSAGPGKPSDHAPVILELG